MAGREGCAGDVRGLREGERGHGREVEPDSGGVAGEAGEEAAGGGRHHAAAAGQQGAQRERERLGR
eukprot:1982081-Rhodomonas_salina.1